MPGAAPAQEEMSFYLIGLREMDEQHGMGDEPSHCLPAQHAPAPEKMEVLRGLLEEEEEPLHFY